MEPVEASPRWALSPQARLSEARRELIRLRPNRRLPSVRPLYLSHLRTIRELKRSHPELFLFLPAS